ncbi:MAG: MFS transporter [Microbacteriaceae bacterium]
MTELWEGGDPATAPIPVLDERPRWRDTFSSLQKHNYRLYVVAQLLSNTSGWMTRIATDWLVFELTGSVTMVGWTVALQFAPMLLFGVFGGVIADRYSKRHLLIGTQLATVVLAGLLGALAILQLVQVWQVYAIAFVLGCVAVLDSPARSAFVNEMVGHSLLRNAISVNASIFHLGGLVGPAISGMLIAVVGAGWAIGVNAVASAIVVVTLSVMRKAELLPSPVIQPARGQIRQAFHYARAKPTIFWPIVMLAFVSTFGMSLPVLLVAFADHVYRTGATGYGLYSSAAAVGALTGAISSARRLTVRLRTIIIAAGAFGAALVLTGLAPNEPLFLIFLASIGFFRLLFATGAESIVQLSSNRSIRGRIMSQYSIVVLGGQSLGGPLMGWIAETWGSNAAMVLAGVVPALAAVAIALKLARSGKLSLRFAVRGRPSFVSIVSREPFVERG